MPEHCFNTHLISKTVLAGANLRQEAREEAKSVGSPALKRKAGRPEARLLVSADANCQCNVARDAESLLLRCLKVTTVQL